MSDFDDEIADMQSEAFVRMHTALDEVEPLVRLRRAFDIADKRIDLLLHVIGAQKDKGR